MFSELLDKVREAGEKKYTFFQKNPGAFFLSSIWAGTMIGIGMILISVIGEICETNNYPLVKIIQGISFSMALSTVVMLGLELFTGNNLVMTVGFLKKKIKGMNLISFWLINYIGNFIGAIILSLLYFNTGIKNTATANYILTLTKLKTEPDFLTLLFKGVLCNILVCLAVLICIKTQNEVAKLIMVFWCIYAFIICGFEHSIANMTLFTIAKMLNPELISMNSLLHNMIPVTIGNMIGGGLILGGSFYYMGKLSN